MTILGVRTVAELEDYITNKNNLVKGMTETYTTVKDRWIAKNRAEHDDWLADWRDFIARYSKAISDARNVTIASGLAFWVPNAVIPSDASYEAITRALTRQTDGSFSKGDVQDLYERLGAVAASLKTKITFDNVQPKPRSDFDLSAYKAADIATKAIEKTASEIGSSKYTWLAGGALVCVAIIAIKK